MAGEQTSCCEKKRLQTCLAAQYAVKGLLKLALTHFKRSFIY